MLHSLRSHRFARRRFCGGTRGLTATLDSLRSNRFGNGRFGNGRVCAACGRIACKGTAAVITVVVAVIVAVEVAVAVAVLVAELRSSSGSSSTSDGINQQQQ